MGFLELLQSSAFGMWVAGGETIWAYQARPLLGANAILHLKIW